MQSPTSDKLFDEVTRPDANDGANTSAPSPEEAEAGHVERAHLPGGPVLYRKPGKHTRAGITKNKSQGTPKAKRRMAKRSRRRNRGN